MSLAFFSRVILEKEQGLEKKPIFFEEKNLCL